MTTSSGPAPARGLGHSATNPQSSVNSAQTSNLTPFAEQFILQDANLMGGRIQWYLEQHERLESLAIIAGGAIWSFLLAQDYSHAIDYLAWLPAVISALLAIKSFIFTKTLSEAFDYLYELETLAVLPGETGWVHFFRARSGKYKRRWRTSFWILLFAGNAISAYVINFQKLLTSFH